MKVDEGLYKYSGTQVYDIQEDCYREIRQYDIPFINRVIEKYKVGDYKDGINIILEDDSLEVKICRNLLVSYIIYAIKISKEVAENVTDCDIAMAEGFNWIPPFALIDLIGKEKCKQIAIEDLRVDEKEVKDIFDKNIKSKYRYERFLKAKR